jgi:hypothetical protein
MFKNDTEKDPDKQNYLLATDRQTDGKIDRHNQKKESS